jgi:predicted permease
MHRLIGWLKQFRVLVRKGNVERELDEELAFHIEMETQQKMREGLSPADARRAALVAFRGVERYKEEVRDARWVRWVESARRDIGHAFHTLRRSPGFALTVALTLAFGMGAVTTLFTVANSVLIRPLPYPHGDRLVAVEHAAPGLGLARTGLSDGLYFHYRARAYSFEDLAVYSEALLTLANAKAGAEPVSVTYAGPEFFRVLGARVLAGRLFREDDGAAGFRDARWPVLLSEELWRRRFGADPGLVGRTIEVNELPRRVVGILPAAFDFPHPGTEIWMLYMPDSVRASAAWIWISAIGRLRPGVTPRAAQAELARVLPSIVGRYRDATADWLRETRLQPVVVPLKDLVVGDVGNSLWMLLAGMALLLLAACANVSNLFLARSEYRAREIAVRLALGARRLDLVRLFAAEALVVSALGAGLGLLLATWGLHALVMAAPLALPRLEEVGIDGHVLALNAGLIAGTASLFALLSLLRHSRETAPNRAQVSTGTRGTVGPGARRARGGFVAAQVALTLTLLVGSVLMLQSFRRLTQVEPGFDAQHVLTVEIGIPYNQAERYPRIYRGLQSELQALPGVRSVGATSDLPLEDRSLSDVYGFRVTSEPADRKQEVQSVGMAFFLPGYLQTMRTGVVEGFGFSPGQHTTTPRPVLVSAALARRLFGQREAVGQRIRRMLPNGSMDPRQPEFVIAGVVGDVHQTSLRDPPVEMVYVPVLDPPVEPGIVPTQMSFVIRSDVPPLAIAPAVRRVIRDFDAGYSIARIRPMEAIVQASTARMRFLTLLLLVAGIASLLLSAVGTYGIVAYAVRQRMREIGIRIAMGATPKQVRNLVLTETAGVLVTGLVIGLPLAIAAARVGGSLLFQMSPTDLPTLVGVTATIAGAALAAAWLPARKATRIDPMEALRSE